MLMESTVTSKGRTTLPKSVRTALGVGAGGRVRYLICGNEVRILPLQPISALFGLLKPECARATLEDMERAIADGACDQ